MSCRYRHILPRDGTNQLDRKLRALGFDYVQIEERSPKEWLEFARELSEEINFYPLDQMEPSGDWKNFFTHQSEDLAVWLAEAEKEQQVPAHLTLFITFLKVLELLKADLNGLTQRHLDYYYRDLLGFSPKSAIADKVHVLVELAGNIEQHRLEAGTLLKAGKDKTGRELFYKLEKETVINRAKVASIKSVFRDPEHQSRIYAAPISNSADGKGKNTGKPNIKWSPFGEKQVDLEADRQTMQETTVGLAIASPLLFLREGQRDLNITIQYSGDLNEQSLEDEDEGPAFALWASGEKGWLDLGRYEPVIEGNLIIFDLIVDRSVAPIVHYREEVHGASLSTNFPVLKLLLNTEAALYRYDTFRDIQIDQVDIRVAVDEIQDLILQNEHGSLDPNGNFLPFGARPAPGSSFLIGSREVFSKKLDSLNIQYEWVGLPASLEDYYIGYSDPLPPASSTDFKAKMAILHGGSWHPIYQTETDILEWVLFPENPNPPITSIGALPADPALIPFERYEPGIKRGFIRLELGIPDFGHSSFAKDFATNILLPEPVAINPPYTPEMKSVSLAYRSSASITLGADSSGELFHVEAFGSRRMGAESTMHFLPQVPRGTLYIGLEDFQPPQNLSLLFQLLEGSGDPDVEIQKEAIQWRVLEGNQWRDLGGVEILEDSTYGLQAAGLIQFSLGEKMNTAHTVLPSGMRWLSATILNDQDPAGAARMLAIEAQAVRAVWVDRDNDPDHLKKPLAPEAIKKLQTPAAAVKNIHQPYVSFGARAAEQATDFYTRVSERLRHKQRLVTLWDAEHLVLEAFPEIYKVKCINHYFQDRELVPGKATVVVIPNLRNKNAVEPLQPRASTALRRQILDYLQQYTSLFVEMEVLNPLYEEVKLEISVGFRPGYDPGFYAQQLNEEIIRFLSPWAFEEGEDIIFGGRIYKSTLIDFIEERVYVDFVTNVHLLHFRNGISFECIGGTFMIGPEAAKGIVTAVTPRSILVSAPQHIIHILDLKEYPCHQSEDMGIGSMTVEGTFIIS